jgi:2'-5' RNA ligase
VRAFLALPVLPPALEEGERLLDRLAGAVPGVRWVRGEGLHLTLHFFPSLDDAEAQKVADAVRQGIAETPRYAARIAGLGCFPRDGDERVLWIGMAEGAAETASLQARVDADLEPAGFPCEQRAFHPHVTLGRPRERFSEPVRRAWKRFAASELPRFEVAEVRLYRSHMGPGGSRYEVLKRLPLRTDAPR